MLSCATMILAWVFAVGLPDAEGRSFATGSSFGFYKGTPGTAYPSAFLGQIYSDKDQCRRHRLVKVFRKRPGPDRRIGRDRTSTTGQWNIDVKRGVPTARYYAKVSRKRFGPQGRHVCRAYRSSALRFGDS